MKWNRLARGIYEAKHDDGREFRILAYGRGYQCDRLNDCSLLWCAFQITERNPQHGDSVIDLPYVGRTLTEVRNGVEEYLAMEVK